MAKDKKSKLIEKLKNEANILQDEKPKNTNKNLVFSEALKNTEDVKYLPDDEKKEVIEKAWNKFWKTLGVSIPEDLYEWLLEQSGDEGDLTSEQISQGKIPGVAQISTIKGKKIRVQPQAWRTTGIAIPMGDRIKIEAHKGQKEVYVEGFCRPDQTAFHDKEDKSFSCLKDAEEDEY